MSLSKKKIGSLLTPLHPMLPLLPAGPRGRFCRGAFGARRVCWSLGRMGCSGVRAPRLGLAYMPGRSKQPHAGHGDAEHWSCGAVCYHCREAPQREQRSTWRTLSARFTKELARCSSKPMMRSTATPRDRLPGIWLKRVSHQDPDQSSPPGSGGSSRSRRSETILTREPFPATSI